ncbi:glucose-6-phosphate dehydrogenase [Egicoccus halophilus]|uniref:Glucose-6-phosphate 1-dehydrogenase n=1 Tax=Egicoccus halophilus TaxID=1670830 RepID=A0A8J3AAK1_9ACTN|nr:glucose-6-phosphate dehydrogenase [Egicoccus halophilus]GGI09179.1 glucose-6-phosphate 1-dehydrogenase [Egicoccus halophilus]
MIRHLIICGANSDVVGRYVIPAIVELVEEDELPEGFTLVGVARQDWDDEAFRDHLLEELAEHAPDADDVAVRSLLEVASFHRADTTEVDELRGLVDHGEPVAVYLALPPTIFAPTVQALDEVGLPDGSRIVVEKPFGEDLAAAQELNRVLHATFPEESIHRVDHFLGMQTVQNLLALRFANRLLEPVWNAHHVERVDIVWDETLTLEGRAGYYDGTGALKDMLQNHLLQVLALVAMDAPASLEAEELRGRKVQVLREVRVLSPEEAVEHSRRARYEAGELDGESVPAYVEEEGVDPELDTETLAELTLAIDSWRWAGVPFRLRAGKALGADRQEVVVRLRPVPHSPFASDAAPNEIRIELEPEHLHVHVNVFGGGTEQELEVVDLDQELPAPEVPAYGRVLRSALAGDPTLSIRDDEAELAWRIVEPVLQAWERGEVPMDTYPAGSDGPDGWS